ncbi:MAG: GTPase [Planctomycetota bacterium]
MKTHVRRLTAPGKSAVAVIEIRGPLVEELLGQCFDAATERDWSSDQIRYGSWRPVSDKVASESVVCIRPRHQRLEVHCHGGEASVERVIQSATELGATRASSWSTVDDSSHEPLLHEAAQVAAQCLSKATAAIALEQYRGCLLDWVKNWLKQLSEADGDSETSLQTIASLRNEAQRIDSYRAASLRLNQPYRVVLAGPPNVGKSSLINAILGYQRNITHDSEGTTRDVLDRSTTLDQIAITLTDTAGMRDLAVMKSDRSTQREIEGEGIRRASRAVGQADVLVLVFDPEHLSEYLAESPRMLVMRPEDAIVLHVLNKSDLLGAAPPKPPSPSVGDGDWIHTSTVHEGGVRRLTDAIISALRTNLPPAGTPLAVTSRQASWIQLVSHATSRSDALQALAGLRRGDAAT